MSSKAVATFRNCSGVVVERELQSRIAPVMRFVADGKGNFGVERMTYRGAGGWSSPLDFGPLEILAKKYLKTLGTEEFFERI